MWAEWRERAGLSQRKLAAKVGVTASFISAFEAGRRGMHVETLDKVCEVLKLSTKEAKMARADVAARRKSRIVMLEPPAEDAAAS